jgi:hypothetical protein
MGNRTLPKVATAQGMVLAVLGTAGRQRGAPVTTTIMVPPETATHIPVPVKRNTAPWAIIADQRVTTRWFDTSRMSATGG